MDQSKKLPRRLLGGARLAGAPPFGPVVDDPIGQCPLKPDIVAGFFGLDPLVLEDLFAFGLKLAVQGGIADEIATGLGLRTLNTHHA